MENPVYWIYLKSIWKAASILLLSSSERLTKGIVVAGFFEYLVLSI